ncbi:uncharacterized protein LOC143082556 [Mytilus galloprovincialis]|uniref:uncharacterized protein LOC143082556 n=1 Tax=Mytilus galloprovincialis TaxID=29158 RepID=UPI003F7CC44C
MAKLIISKEIIVNVDELQRQSSINASSHIRYVDVLKTSEESEPVDFICPSGLAILCCLPLGICAMLAADTAIKSRASGDHDKARKKNTVALVLIVVALVIGSSGLLIYLSHI